MDELERIEKQYQTIISDLRERLARQECLLSVVAVDKDGTQYAMNIRGADVTPDGTRVYVDRV